MGEARLAASGLGAMGRPARLRQSVISLFEDPVFRRVIVIVAALRIGLGVVAALVVRFSALDRGPLSGVLPHSTNPIATYLITPWERFDALNYERIASAGYQHGQLDQVFFPLFPALERAVSFVTGGSLGLAGLVVSTVALVVALLLLRRLVAADVDGETADLTVLYMAFAPVAFFFLAPYSDALFLALSVGAILAARRRRFVLAGALTALATLARPQGILVALPVAIELFAETRRARREGRPQPWLGWAALAAAPAALAAFVGYTKSVSGLNPLEAEQLWLVHLAPPWQGLVDTVHDLPHHWTVLVNPAAVLLGLAALSLMIVRRPRLPLSYIAYTAASLLVIASRESDFAGRANPLVSADRFALVVFPLFVMLAIVTRGRTTLTRMLIAASVLLMLARFTIFVHNSFAA